MSILRLELAFARAILALPAPVLRAVFGAPITSPDGLRLDLQTQVLLQLARHTRQPDIAELGVEGGRRYMEKIGPSMDAHAADVDVRDTTVPGAEGPRRARVYTPRGEPRRAPFAGRPLPALVYFHGGGFVVGSLDSHDGGCRALASRAGVAVVSVDYRLAPEHPFPAAVDDGLAATRWVLERGGSLGIDPSAVAVGGDSAGGTLAAAVSQALRGAPRAPVLQLLVYPVTNVLGGTRSREYFREGFFLTKTTIDWYTRQYIPDVEQHTDPRASPLLAPDVSGLPPALVVTAGFDALRDEGLAYAEKMRAAGVEVEYLCSEGSMHGFFNTSGVLRESVRVMDFIAARLRRALSSSARGSGAPAATAA